MADGLSGVSLLGLALGALIGLSLGFFGGGGSTLTVPLLVYVFGLDAREAIASSLLIVAVASASGAVQHWRAGNVSLHSALVFGIAGMAGAHLGGRIGARMDPALLLLLFAAMMLLTAVAMWRGGRRGPGPPTGGHAPARLALQGLGVGLCTGLVGAGGGFLIVPALVLWAGLGMREAIGTSLLVIVLNCLAGFAGYATRVEVSWGLVAALTAAAIAGSFAGARLARQVDPAALRRAFAAFVGAMALLVLAAETGAWADAARESLPGSMPQLVFAVLMLVVGFAVGRVAHRTRSDPLREQQLTDGAGI